jgi:hypothetical protein
MSESYYIRKSFGGFFVIDVDRRSHDKGTQKSVQYIVYSGNILYIDVGLK